MSKLIDVLNTSQKIAIVSHIDPDPDAIASCLLTKRWINLNYIGKSVDIFLDGNISDLYTPLLENQEINTYELKKYDTAIVLDCPSIERTGNYADLVKSCPTILNIDHHENNNLFGTLNYVAKKSSSTGELLYIILDHISPITDDKLAEYAYHSIITDTNNFSSLSMSKRTHLTLYKILEKNFDATAIKQHYFNNISKSKQFLIKKSINSMHFVCDDRLAIMSITNKDMVTGEAEFADTLGLIENGINVSGVDIAIMFIEKQPEEYYVSLRSKGNIKVSEIAKIFDGGGHDNMAAFQCKTDNIKDLKAKVIEECAKILAKYPATNTNDDIFNET